MREKGLFKVIPAWRVRFEEKIGGPETGYLPAALKQPILDFVKDELFALERSVRTEMSRDHQISKQQHANTATKTAVIHCIDIIRATPLALEPPEIMKERIIQNIHRIMLTEKGAKRGK